jgi:hypothetical protein
MIHFKDLDGFLKAVVIGSCIVICIYALTFIVGFIIGMVS